MLIRILEKIENGGNFLPPLEEFEIEWDSGIPPEVIVRNDKAFKFVSWKDGFPNYVFVNAAIL